MMRCGVDLMRQKLVVGHASHLRRPTVCFGETIYGLEIPVTTVGQLA